MPQKIALITAGPTEEAIDPVRFLSNHSSGKMGYALAIAAKKRGYRVILITGPTKLPPPRGIKVIRVTTAREMLHAVMQNYKKAALIIKSAAVADYRPMSAPRHKIKKKKKTISLRLTRNPDILRELGKRKKRGQVLAGFAAETASPLKNGFLKLKNKNCDWMIVNDVSKKGIGFGLDENEITLLSSKGVIVPLKRSSKISLAFKILDILTEHRL